MNKLQKELYGSWSQPTPEEQRMQEMAAKYYRLCDAYDSRVCSGISPRSGEPMPVTPDEFRRVNNHALHQRDELMREYGVPGVVFHAALKTYMQHERPASREYRVFGVTP